MKKDKLSFKEVIAKFDEFEEQFTKDSNNAELLKFFENFADVITNGDFGVGQLRAIRERMAYLRQLFDKRKEELRAMGAEAIAKHKQVDRYIKNVNYKNMIR
ncbi:MAG: hypothetical protein Tsb006_7370 [Rickettsiaceae bacterium]